MDSHKAAVAAGIAGGYLLGRRHKAKLALVVATYVAGRRFRLSPTGLAAAGLRKIQDNPQFAEATERLRGQVLDAGRTAAQERISALTDTLREKTEALGGPLGSGDGADDEDDEDREEEQGGEPERHDSHRHRDRSHRRRAQADDEDDEDDEDDAENAEEDEDEEEAPEDREEPPQRKQRKKAAAAKAAHTKKAAGASKRAARSTSRSQRER
ncbi:hypothetical protein [Streptomyces sp. NPDC049879]|uniref:hypothetical protein n=1 Tax=Streptomyces sp. NPDC049879 TaxID=3365598 RepID=UPI003798ABB3